MHFETAIVMVVGIVALVSLRMLLAFVGKEYAADHPGSSIRRDDPTDLQATPRVVRGTGRNSHLLYFRDGLPPVPPAARVAAAPDAGAPLVPLPQRRAS